MSVSQAVNRFIEDYEVLQRIDNTSINSVNDIPQRLYDSHYVINTHTRLMLLAGESAGKEAHLKIPNLTVAGRVYLRDGKELYQLCTRIRQTTQ